MGADVNISSKSWNHATSLHFCSQLGKLQNIRLLLNYGANMYIKDKCGLTARDRAKKHPECEEVLLKHEGLCALYGFCFYFYFFVVLCLLVYVFAAKQCRCIGKSHCIPATSMWSSFNPGLNNNTTTWQDSTTFLSMFMSCSLLLRPSIKKLELHLATDITSLSNLMLFSCLATSRVHPSLWMHTNHELIIVNRLSLD